MKDDEEHDEGGGGEEIRVDCWMAQSAEMHILNADLGNLDLHYYSTTR